MVDRSKDDLYTWTLEHEAMKAAGCCLTLFDPAKGAPEVEFELSRRELEPMDVTVTRDEQVRFEGGRLLTLREAESTRTWRQEQEIHSLPAPPGEPGGFVFVWAGEVRLTNEDVNMWRGHYRVDADCPWPDHRACLQCPRCAQPAAPGGDATYIMVWQTLAQITETGPKFRMRPRLFCRPCIQRIVQLADLRFARESRGRDSTGESPRDLTPREWEDFLDSTEPFGERHRFAAGPLTAHNLQRRWVVSGTFNAVFANWPRPGAISRTATPGGDPPARCHREGCERARAPDGMPLKTCARCRSVMYCSPDCQKADWKRHRGDCRLLKAERQINHFERRLHAAKAGFM